MCKAIEDMKLDSWTEGKAEGIAEGISKEKQNTERERKRADAAEARVKELEAMLAMKQ